MGTIRVRYLGNDYVVNEEDTGADVKAKLNVSPEYMLVTSEGNQVKQLRDNQRVGDVLKDGQPVIPMVQPRYG